MKLYRKLKLDSLMDSDDLQEEIVSVTGDKRSRALSASSAGGPRKNPRLEVARFVSLTVMFIFICFPPGAGTLPGSYRGSRGGCSPVRYRVPPDGRLEKRTCYQGRALERERRDI